MGKQSFIVYVRQPSHNHVTRIFVARYHALILCNHTYIAETPTHSYEYSYFDDAFLRVPASPKKEIFEHWECLYSNVVGSATPFQRISQASDRFLVFVIQWTPGVKKRFTLLARLVLYPTLTYSNTDV